MVLLLRPHLPWLTSWNLTNFFLLLVLGLVPVGRGGPHLAQMRNPFLQHFNGPGQKDQIIRKPNTLRVSFKRYRLIFLPPRPHPLLTSPS